jgi:hypothetical protein
LYLYRVPDPNQQGQNQHRGGNEEREVATTDGAGKFSFGNVVPGRIVVVAFAREFAPGETDPVEVTAGGAAPAPVQVRLRQGLTVLGEVRDLQDNPLPDIRVQLQRWWGGGGQPPGYKYVFALNALWSEMPVVYTDRTGKFELAGALPGKQWLSAWDRTYGWTGRQLEGVEGERITDVIISFAGATIEGVFKNGDGEPVAGASVYAIGPKNTPRRNYRWTQTDGLGRFKLGGLEDGMYDVRASSSLGTPTPLQDVPAGTRDVELTMQAGQVLSGSVVSVRTGRAVERYYLLIQPHREAGRRRRSGGSSWSGWIETPDGRFERPVIAGTYDVTIKAAEHAPRHLERVVVEESIAPQPLYVTLDAGSGIRGVARDAEGAPLADVTVYARVQRAPGEQQQPTDWTLGGNDQTDGRGRFFIEGVGAGVYVIQINLGQRGIALAQVTVSGTEMVEKDLRLLPTGQLVLTVKDEKGEAAQGVGFSFKTEQGDWVGWSHPSDAQGVSRAQSLPMGSLIAQPWSNNNAYEGDPFPVTVEAGKIVAVEARVKKREQPNESAPR